MVLILICMFAGESFIVNGVADGETVVGSVSWEAPVEWDLEDFIGLEVLVQGETVAYYDEPPFEGVFSLEKFREGILEIEWIASFFRNRKYTHLITVNHLKHAYEETVHLVQVPITMQGDLESIQASNFSILENGSLKPVTNLWDTEAPLDLVILLDSSGSMEDRLPIMRGLIKEFMEYLSEMDRVKVIGFFHRVFEISDFTSDKKFLSKKLLMVRPGGDTNLYGALWAGVRSLSKAERRRAVLLLTDGRHQMDLSTKNPFTKTLEEGLDLAKKYMIPIYVIGIGYSTDPAILMQIAEETGGVYFKSIKRQKIREGFQLILSELKRQHILGYYHEKGAGWCDIEVKYLGDKGTIKSSPKQVYIQ